MDKISVDISALDRLRKFVIRHCISSYTGLGSGKRMFPIGGLKGLLPDFVIIDEGRDLFPQDQSIMDITL
jgi:hypothetical protein